MEKSKSKCTCAQRGVMCGRKLSLIKKEKLSSTTIEKEEVICPLKNVLTYTS
jgi:hypothetical protein